MNKIACCYSLDISFVDFVKKSLPDWDVLVCQSFDCFLESCLSKSAKIALIDCFIETNKACLVCRKLRLVHNNFIPVLAVRTPDSFTTIEILDAGADGCIATKNLCPQSINAHIKALIRRETTMPPIPRIGNLELDLKNRFLKYKQAKIRLSVKEFLIFESLLYSRKPLDVFVLMDLCYDNLSSTSFNTIKAHIHKLRRKLDRIGVHKKALKSKRAIGYFLDPSVLS